MLVGIAVGGIGVKVSVGGARVGWIAVSVKIAVGGAVLATTETGTLTGAAEGSVQAVSRKISVREVERKFFIIIYLF